MTPTTLRNHRKRLALTQGELAARLGVARSTVARWELGSPEIPVWLGYALAAMAAGLDPVE